jgi:hypothetical protein
VLSKTTLSNLFHDVTVLVSREQWNLVQAASARAASVRHERAGPDRVRPAPPLPRGDDHVEEFGEAMKFEQAAA